jgi:hypothetical protein
MTTETTAATATESTVEIVYLDGGKNGTSLHHRYPRQTSPQDCYVQLDCETGKLLADWNGEIGNAVPVRVHHGHVQRWGIPALRDGAANALLEEIAPLAERVVAGYDSEWDGNNHVAAFDDDASEAIVEISALCERAEGDAQEDGVRVWDAADWYGGVGDHDAQRRSLGITAATTDAELDAIETREDESAKGNECDEIEGHAKHLHMLRDEAREASAESDLTLHIRRDGCDGDVLEGYDTLEEAIEVATSLEVEVRGYIDGRHVLTVQPDGAYRWV